MPTNGESEVTLDDLSARCPGVKADIDLIDFEVDPDYPPSQDGADTPPPRGGNKSELSGTEAWKVTRDLTINIIAGILLNIFWPMK